MIADFCDDGPGVSDEDIPHLFDSFYRADKARTSPEKGSGLGLAIVKRIIEGHNGAVSCHTDNGLVIRIILPIIKEDSK